jgi:hypothetical protein
MDAGREFYDTQDAKVKQARERFQSEATSFSKCEQAGGSRNEQISRLNACHQAAREFFRELNEAVADPGPLTGILFEQWKQNCLASAVNVLSGLPRNQEYIRKHRDRLGIPATNFEFSPAVFENMQSIVAWARPEEAKRLRDEFQTAALPAGGFDRPRKIEPAGQEMASIGVFDSFPAAKVVFPLHGIRTRAEWQKEFSDLAHTAEWDCRLAEWFFGKFSVLQFFWPFSREAKVRWFRATYDRELNCRDLKLVRNQYPSVTAHSFGTYILGYALLRYEYIRFNKVILCGSILPRDFPWDKLIERGQVQAVRNEYGVKDFWANRVGQFVPNTGRSGSVGFLCSSPRLDQQKFNYTHSEYFETGHMREYWIRFLDKTFPLVPATQTEVEYPKRSQPWLLYAILLLALAGAVLISLDKPIHVRSWLGKIAFGARHKEPSTTVVANKNKAQAAPETDEKAANREARKAATQSRALTIDVQPTGIKISDRGSAILSVGPDMIADYHAHRVSQDKEVVAIFHGRHYDQFSLFAFKWTTNENTGVQTASCNSFVAFLTNDEKTRGAEIHAVTNVEDGVRVEVVSGRNADVRSTFLWSRKDNGWKAKSNVTNPAEWPEPTIVLQPGTSMSLCSGCPPNAVLWPPP